MRAILISTVAEGLSSVAFTVDQNLPLAQKCLSHLQIFGVAVQQQFSTEWSSSWRTLLRLLLKKSQEYESFQFKKSEDLEHHVRTPYTFEGVLEQDVKDPR